MPASTEHTPVPSGFQELAAQSRVDARMRSNGEYTTEERIALCEELQDWRLTQRTPAGKPLPWTRVAEQIGINPTILGEVRHGTYKGDTQKQLKLIDQFLADERIRAGRFDDRAFAVIGIVRMIWAVLLTCIKHCSMGLVCADPGDGKSTIARAFASDREGVVLIRIDQAHRDARGVTALLYGALRLVGNKNHRERMSAIVTYLRKRQSTVILVDEAQKLKPDGLEILRDLHDASDPDNRRNTPVVFFADHDFWKLILRTRNGEPSPIKSQLTRRLYPCLNVEGELARTGGDLFTVADVTKILRNDRLRVVTAEGVKWLRDLANVRGWGSLGFAMAVARMAVDVCKNPPVGIEDLRAALQMAVGPRDAALIDEAADGLLLRAVG